MKAGTTTEIAGRKKFGQVAKEDAACARLSTARTNTASRRRELDVTRSVQLSKVLQKQKDDEEKEKEAEVADAEAEERRIAEASSG